VERDERAIELVKKNEYEMKDLLTLMAVLRSERGCPWDKQQTHSSLRKYLIEETYEVAEAIDRSDMALMREELGDLLFEIVFHTQVAEEEGHFTFSDVVNDICKKMIVRHPHVFGDSEFENEDQINASWESIKMQTKEQKTTSEVLDSVSRSLPSLMRAAKISSKSKKANNDPRPTEELIGDMLFEIASLCGDMGIDPEKALYDSCERAIAAQREKERNESDET